TFTDSSSGSPTSWLWNFGDGVTSTSQNPKHVFTHVGTYTVVLRATNQAGSATASHTVTVVTCSPDAGVSCRATPQVSSPSIRSPRSVSARPPR
ncbi:MAG TPA: PKD domain-containing protein, partial [Thermoanaerobaculia bacterium]|nr:PKD domain-containing protein [Thermoanaerobaculia bacterium]